MCNLWMLLITLEFKLFIPRHFLHLVYQIRNRVYNVLYFRIKIPNSNNEFNSTGRILRTKHYIYFLFIIEDFLSNIVLHPLKDKTGKDYFLKDACSSSVYL